MVFRTVGFAALFAAVGVQGLELLAFRRGSGLRV